MEAHDEMPKVAKSIVILIFSLSHADGFIYTITTQRSCDRLPQAAWQRRMRLNDSVAPVETLEKNTKTKKIHVNSLNLLDKCTSTSQAQRVLENELLGNEGEALYKSITIPPGASAKGISDGDLAIQTRLANKKYKITELIELNGNRDIDRASAWVFGITVSSIISSLSLNQNLPGPDIIRFLLVWIVTFAPFAFIGYGLKDADKLQEILVSIQRNVFPAYRKRMIHHEAGHFLVGYLLGWPIAGYQTNAVKNAVEFYPLSDRNKGRDFAQQLGFDKPSKFQREVEQIQRTAADVPFFSDEGRGALLLEESSVFRKENNTTNESRSKLPSDFEPKNAWPYRGFDERTLDQLTVISVAGICSEILAFGNAEGGVADLGQLKQIYNSAAIPISERERENRIRFALGYTISQLRRHLRVLDALVEVMERGGSVSECVFAIENCRIGSGPDDTTDGYEVRRRAALRSEGLNIFERVFLGDDKNIDAVEDRLREGVGGGGKKETFRLVGDDPLYAALAMSLAFLAWASSGGISLH